MKFSRIHALIAFGIVALSYQNCGREGFIVQPQDSVTPTGEMNVSTTDATELGQMLKVFGTGSTTTLSNPCEFLGQPTLPLVTHYPTLGAKDQPQISSSRGHSEYIVDRKPVVPIYDIAKFPVPSVGNYIGDSFAIESFPLGVSDNETRFSSRLKQLCVSDLTAVRFIQGSHQINSAGDLAALVVPNAPYFQILHGLVFKNNLFTVVVPPRWSKATSSTLPTLFNGFYDLNTNFMQLEGQPMLKALANVYQAKGKSGFGLLWNGGGAVGSRTVDNNAFVELNQFLAIYLTDLGPAQNKFVTFGASRGGITSLNVASHPAVTAASVAFVYSSVPPYELNTVASLATPTVPMLLFSSDWSVGFIGSWQNSFLHPSGFGRVGFQGLTGIESHLKVLTGASRNSDVSREFNALTNAKTAKLIRNRTQIMLEAGSHDFIVPSTDQLRLVRDGIAAGIQMEARINYLYGHGHDDGARQSKLQSVLGILIDQDPAVSNFVTRGRISRYVASPQGTFTSLSSPIPPLTVEIPRYVIDESDPMILATGPSNQHFLLAFKKGAEITKVNLDLDAKGLLNLRLPHSLFPSGDYELLGAYSVDSQGRPINKIKITSLATRTLVISRFSGDLRPLVPNASGTIDDGIKAEGRYFNPGVATGTNYGFLQNGTSTIPRSELALVFPTPTPTPTDSANSDTDSNGDSSANSDTDSNGDSSANSDADSNGDSSANSDTDSNGDSSNSSNLYVRCCKLIARCILDVGHHKAVKC